MKINKNYFLIFTLSFIMFCLYVNSASLRKRTERVKFQSLAKLVTEGSGSWEKGFNCPRIKLTINNVKTEEAKDVKFQPNGIVSPKTDLEKLGWVFTSNNPGENLQKFIFKYGAESNTWYIPYRYMSSEATYSNPWGDNKKITEFLKNDEGEVAKFTLYLPYKLIGWFINDDEGNLIATNLNKNSISRKNNIKQYKASAIAHAAEYYSAELLSNSVDKGKCRSEAQPILQESKLIALQETINTQRKDAENLTNIISEMKNNLSEKQKKIDEINAKIKSHTAELSTTTNNLNKIKSDGMTTAQIKKKNEDAAKTSLEKLDTYLNQLKVEAPPRTIVMKKAKEAVINFNTKDFVNRLMEVRPIN